MPQRKTVKEVNYILELYKSGYSQNRIFKTLGVDRGTIRQIVNDPEGYLKKATIEFDLSEINKKSYAFILGVYLGDGCISKTHKPNVFRLRVALDIKYKKLNEEVIEELQKLFPNNNVNYMRVGETNGCVISLYSTHLLKLFPQHDIGKKHDRPIVLEDWQKDIIDEYNIEFLKGLIYIWNTYSM
jgi:intein-encoded DNA endonuclease-like protein